MRKLENFKIKKTFVLAAGLVLLLALSGCLRTRGGNRGPVTLTVYGLDDSDVFGPIITDYRAKHGNVKINYKKFNDAREYEDLVINEIAEGEGPDIFYIHNTWLPRHSKKVVPLISEDYTARQFGEDFVKVASDDFIQPDPADGNRKIYALPLYVDTLALYYNKEHFEKKLPETGKPAATWELLKEQSAKLREQSADGKLQRGGFALGRADNLQLAPDILYNLFLQAGVDFYDANFEAAQFASRGRETFEYFVSFGNPRNKNFSYSLDAAPLDRPLKEVEAFLAGKASAIFGYSSLYPRLENDLKNVRSRNRTSISMNDVGVAPSPQIATDSNDYKVWADYYGLAVSRNSKNAAAGWDFIQFATDKKSSENFHKKTKRPTARRDLIEDQKKEPVTEIFVSQLGFAESFRIYSDSKFEEIFREAVQNAVNGQTPREAIGAAQTKINEYLKVEAPDGLYPKPKKNKK